MKKIFGYTPEEIEKLSGKDGHEVDPQYKMGPINPDDDFLEPCLRGAEKIINDPLKREILKDIYRGHKDD